jgi:hypothetical protein
MLEFPDSDSQNKTGFHALKFSRAPLVINARLVGKKPIDNERDLVLVGVSWAKLKMMSRRLQLL